MDAERLFQLLGLALTGAAMSISIYFRSRAHKSGDKISSRKEEGTLRLALRSIFGLATWGGVLAYLINPRWMAWSQLDLPGWLRWLGVGLMASVVPLAYWVFTSLDKNITHTVAIRREHRLIRHGPYRWVRHPLYSMGMVFYLGISLLSASWFIAVAGAAGIGVILTRTPLEEARLMERFGDEYREYSRTTGRYFPRL